MRLVKAMQKKRISSAMMKDSRISLKRITSNQETCKFLATVARTDGKSDSLTTTSFQLYDLTHTAILPFSPYSKHKARPIDKSCLKRYKLTELFILNSVK